jgi:hypothetical protein
MRQGFDGHASFGVNSAPLKLQQEAELAIVSIGFLNDFGDTQPVDESIWFGRDLVKLEFYARSRLLDFPISENPLSLGHIRLAVINRGSSLHWSMLLHIMEFGC